MPVCPRLIAVMEAALQRQIRRRRRSLSLLCVSPVQVPSRVEALRLAALSPTSVQVSWEPPGHPNGPILGYRLLWTESPSGKEQVGAAVPRPPRSASPADGAKVFQRVSLQSVEVNGLTYKMDGLSRFTEYSVRVLALNRYGPGPATEAASVTTQSDGESRRTSTRHPHPSAYPRPSFFRFPSAVHPLFLQFRTRLPPTLAFLASFCAN